MKNKVINPLTGYSQRVCEVLTQLSEGIVEGDTAEVLRAASAYITLLEGEVSGQLVPRFYHSYTEIFEVQEFSDEALSMYAMNERSTYGGNPREFLKNCIPSHDSYRKLLKYQGIYELGQDEDWLRAFYAYRLIDFHK